MGLDKSLEGNWGTLGWRPPLSTKVSAGWPCGIGPGQSEGPEPRNEGQWELRPYERNRCAEHGASK
jgi:hypothetical protein